ncbi:MAG: ADP-forming succinate--CoA ligase subunit beta [Mariprofundaceae bacterium]
MNIHEYQAKDLLADCGVSTPRGVLAHSVEEAVTAAESLGGAIWVVKAQIHAGGRGKAGGVRLCKSLSEVRAAASAILHQVLITKQTGAAGKEVRKLYIEEGLSIAHEYYVSLLIDREAETIAFVVSQSGGMDIEQVAQDSPEHILTLSIDNAGGLSPYAWRRMAFFLGLTGDGVKQFGQLATQLYHCFQQHDANLLELNPLVMTEQGKLVALDAKVAVDDNALYRQPEMLSLRDTDEEDARETEAAIYGLNYIQLDGSIGCMVNGAGLAMATMDIIQLKGGRPANFLDVGGGVTVEAVKEAFTLLFSDRHVKAVLVNIFGGIVRCDIIANGLLEAVQKKSVPVPVVMRLVGTHEEEGRQLIHDSDLDVHWADDLDQAATLAVQVIGATS